MKRIVSFLLGVAVVVGVGVLFFIFAHHGGPGDSPRDDDNTKTVAATKFESGLPTDSTPATGGGGGSTTSTGGGGGGTMSMAAAKSTFTSTCGGCHTLADAGTKGNVGPNLDQLKPNDQTVAHQIQHGGGAMPAGLLKGAQLTAVAKYVSSVAGKG
jgi:mono/diheme cytochrome c family protein